MNTITKHVFFCQQELRRSNQGLPRALEQLEESSIEPRHNGYLGVGNHNVIVALHGIPQVNPTGMLAAKYFHGPPAIRKPLNMTNCKIQAVQSGINLATFAL